MVVDAPVGHQLVDEETLRASLVVLGAVADQLHQVGMVHDSQHVHLRQPLLVPLESIPVQVLDSNLLFLSRATAVEDGASVDAAEATLAEHERPAEVAGGGTQLGEGEDSQVCRPVHEARVLPLLHGLDAHVGGVDRTGGSRRDG